MFSDNLTQQQKDDFLAVRGIDFDTFCQRQITEVTQNAILARIQQILTKTNTMTPNEQTAVLTQVQTVIGAANANPLS